MPTLVIKPLEALEAFESQMPFLIDQYNSRQQYFDLGDAGGQSPYQEGLCRIDHLIGKLKRLRAELQEVSKHQHVWDENEYCEICHADGRA